MSFPHRETNYIWGPKWGIWSLWQVPIRIPSFHYIRLQRWLATIPSLDQWWKTIVNHWNQWLPDLKTIEKPLISMLAPNHSIQWWWCPRKSLNMCDGSKKWAKVKQSTVKLWTILNFAVVKALLSSPFIIINHFVPLWNWIYCDLALFRSLFMSQNHRWPSHLKFVKTIEKPSLSMVNLRKNI